MSYIHVKKKIEYRKSFNFQNILAAVFIDFPILLAYV